MTEPEYIPRDERKDPRLAHVSLLAFLLDRAFKIPGTNWRFGLDSLIGLVPGLGDIIGSMIGGYSIWIARQIGAPTAIQLRMAMNLGIDGLLGIVPLAGDIFDFAFKAHSRNEALLTQWLATPHRTQRSSIGVLVLAAVMLVAICAAGVWMLAAAIRWVAGLF